MTAHGPPKRSTAPVWGLVIILGMMLTAGVFLAMAGWKPESIAGLLAAVGAAAGGAQLALSKLATLDERTQAIETRAEVLAQEAVARSTDEGEISATVQSAVHRAIDLRLGPAEPPRRRGRGRR